MALGTVVLRRTWGGMPGATPEDWRIVLDGKEAGYIAKDGTVELSVEPGHHTLSLRSKRHVSRERAVDLSDGKVVNFSSHEPRVWPMMIAALIVPDRWITLRQD